MNYWKGTCAPANRHAPVRSATHRPTGDRGQRCVQAHQRICRERGGDRCGRSRLGSFPHCREHGVLDTRVDSACRSRSPRFNSNIWPSRTSSAKIISWRLDVGMSSSMERLTWLLKAAVCGERERLRISGHSSLRMLTAIEVQQHAVDHRDHPSLAVDRLGDPPELGRRLDDREREDECQNASRRAPPRLA